MAQDLQEVYEAALAELPPKQRKLVTEYLRDLHQRNAAIRAGYTPEYASTILRNLKIQTAIQAGMALMAMPKNEVLYRLTEQARSSLDDFLDDAGDIDLKKARDRGKLHLLKSRSVTKEGERIELYSAQEALQLLGKAHGLFVDRQEITGKDGAPIAVVSAADLAEARKKAQQWEAEQSGRHDEN